MATLTIDRIWINLAVSGADDYVKGLRDASESDSRSSVGRIVQYTGGRQRGITQKGVATGWSFTLRGVTAADTDKLASWIGQTVLVRDNRGRKVWGFYLAVPRVPWKEQLDLYDVSLSVLGVDYEEGA